jgi:TorA maturation chaperone TorD
VHAPSAGPSHSNAGAARTAPLPLSGEDQARADLYALLARLLLAAPDDALLGALAAADPICADQGSHALEEAWYKLTLAAAVTDAEAIADEFASLFVSVGTPLLNPYESRYLSGFINDMPLAELRADLATLGVARASGAGDFEDHLGALCETMRVLITGAPRIPRQPVARQIWFFERHLAPWAARCLADIAAAPGASFYRLVAGFALAFFAIEGEAFAFEESIDD